MKSLDSTMDPIQNPYAPGAGTPPPELSGRDAVLDQASLASERVRRGRPAQSLLLIGLRGVGKTVLLERMRLRAIAAGLSALKMEAPDGRSLPAMLLPELRLALLRLSRRESARDVTHRALRALAGFARGLKVKYHDIEVGFDADPEVGLADNGHLELDLQALLEAAGEAAQEAQTALVLLIDELQYVEQAQLAALISALHHCTQRQLPIVLIGAGLPTLRAQVGLAKSYAERLFAFVHLGPLDPEAARQAIARPAEAEGVDVEPAALERIVEATQGYAYFLQEWAKHAWDAADGDTIRLADVEAGATRALASLDEGFFRVRFERLTPMERRYLRAMAELGPGPHRSGLIAGVLQRGVTGLAPVRASLTRKGMVWSPGHGDTAFTVPLFDDFMRRTMPGEDWRL